MTTRVLVVDDEPQILRTLSINLRTRGYQVDLAQDGERALELAARHHPDVVILDLTLPSMHGVDVIRGLRGWSRVPIVVLSVHDTEVDKVAALDAGADDYITKPFGMNELLARLRAAVRRSAPADEPGLIETADFAIDLAAKRVTRNTKEIRLTPTEWHLVETLVRNRGKLVAQRQLLREILGPPLRATHRIPTRPHSRNTPQTRTRALTTPLLPHRPRHGLPLRASSAKNSIKSMT